MGSRKSRGGLVAPRKKDHRWPSRRTARVDRAEQDERKRARVVRLPTKETS